MPAAQQGNVITDTAQIVDGIVATADIADGAITNAKVNASAAIAASKLSNDIANANISASAAIVDTKLAQIATAGKVAGDALTSLANIPSGAGVIPTANVPAATLELTATASDTLEESADTERLESNTSYTKYKDITVRLNGTIRVKFDLKTTNVATTAYGRVYKNGVAFGTEQTNATASYVTKSEDLTFEAGDLIQLYIKTNNGSFNGAARNFRLYYDKTTLVETTVNLD